MRAVFSPGPSYFSGEVRKYAGWVKILDMYVEGLKELGFDVEIPHVDPSLIDSSSTVSKILSYDLVAASQVDGEADLFLGPPGYSNIQMMTGGMVTDTKRILYVWNNADWWRDQQLEVEYKKFNLPYDMSPTWRWINRQALQSADHIIACSPWVKKTHSKIVDPRYISINRWGVDSEHFVPGSRQRQPGDPLKVLFVGGDPIRKGLRYLLDATVGLEKDVEMWVVGCDIREIPGIRSFGMIPHSEMLEIYQHCDVICIPTLEDGIALAIQEGMACGCVPITTPEAAEVFDVGESGFMVGYREVGDITHYLEMLRDKPEILKPMSIAARLKAESTSWDDTKESFKNIIIKEMDL